jgi:hypothetical protein
MHAGYWRDVCVNILLVLEPIAYQHSRLEVSCDIVPRERRFLWKSYINFVRFSVWEFERRVAVSIMSQGKNRFGGVCNYFMATVECMPPPCDILQQVIVLRHTPVSCRTPPPPTTPFELRRCQAMFCARVQVRMLLYSRIPILRPSTRVRVRHEALRVRLLSRHGTPLHHSLTFGRVSRYFVTQNYWGSGLLSFVRNSKYKTKLFGN